MTAPYYADESVTLHLGDCLDVLRTMEGDSIDAIVTDPPAGIAFMGRSWDDFARTRARFVDMLTERMAEAYRVLKPGGHALVWAIPRTSHWTAWALEDAGFDIRDCVLHLFGSGFPKSRDVSKAIDQEAGAEREIVGDKLDRPGYHLHEYDAAGEAFGQGINGRTADERLRAAQITAPATEDAARWEGWGTALKPGQELWWLARKPLEAGTVAANVLRWGTGALNVAACKVAHASEADRAESEGNYDGGAGRWPANIVFTHSAECAMIGDCAPDCPVREIDRQAPAAGSFLPPGRNYRAGQNRAVYAASTEHETSARDLPGGASRFFPVFRYQAKAPASERPRLPDGTAHETVKSLGLISWLIRLITPPGGTVLDMFAGSGPTAEACIIEGFRCILIEREPKSAELIKKRLSKPIQPVMFGLDIA